MNPRSITSEEPGISVSAPATSPPVQDSAVAMVSLRIRHRSSSERERARASPLISSAPAFAVRALIVPRQTNGGACRRGDSFLAARKAEPLAGGRFYRDARDIQSRDLGDACAHGVAQGSDFRPLADQRYFQIGDATAARGDPIDRVFQEFVGGRALPLDVAGGEMRTDIAVRKRAEDGIDQRVESNVAVGMGEEAAMVRHANAANHQVIALAKGVNVVAGPGSDVAEQAGQARFFADEI